MRIHQESIMNGIKLTNEINEIDMQKSFIIAQYFLEYSLLNCNMSSKKPSLKAASAYYLGLKMTNSYDKFNKTSNWSNFISDLCDVHSSLVKTTAIEMCKYHENTKLNNKLNSICEKFMKEEYLYVSILINQFCSEN